MLLASFAALALSAAVDAPVTAATLYSTGAQVTRTAHVQADGPTRIELPLLPSTVRPESIRIESSDAEVRRVDIARVDETAFPVDEARKLLDQLDALDDQISQASSELQSRRELAQLFHDLRPQAPADLAGRPPPRLDPSPWKSAQGFVASWLDKLQAQIRDDTERVNKLNRDRNPLLERARLLEAERRGGWRVTAQVAGHGAAELRLLYETRQARWVPTYDLQLDPATGVVSVSLAGLVTQQTGDDWKEIALTLSTAIPTTSTRLPELMTWKIGERERFIPTPYAAQPPVQPPPPAPPLPREAQTDAARVEQRLLARIGGRGNSKNDASRTATGAADLDGEPQQSVDDLGQSLGGMAPKEEAAKPAYRPPPPKGSVRNYPASPAPSAAPGAPAAAPEPLLEADERESDQKEAVVTTAVGLAPPPGAASQPIDPNSAAGLAGGYDLVFHALRKETVESGGTTRRVALVATKWPVSVERQLFPALAPEAFLTAELKSPEKQALPGGEAHLFVGADPAGVAQLKLMAPGDQFSLPLGVDRALTPIRNVKLVQAEKGVFSKDEVTDYVVTIELANPYPATIPVRVFDQWPLSNEKNVEIKLLETRPYAAQEAITGKLEWRVQLPPRSATKLQFTYRIRRPKGYRLTQ